MTLSHTFRDKGNGDCAVCSEDWDHPYHTGSNPDELAKAADALLKAIEVWEACYLDSVWRDQVQPARQKLAEVIDATPAATPVQPTASVEAVAELIDSIAKCHSENAMDRAFLDNADEIAAAVLKLIADRDGEWACTVNRLEDEIASQGDGEPDWSKIPKQALVDALRNCMLGPSNVSRQDKCDLVAIAKRALSTLGEDRRKALLDAIETETAYRTKRTTPSSPVPAPSPAGVEAAVIAAKLRVAALHRDVPAWISRAMLEASEALSSPATPEPDVVERVGRLIWNRWHARHGGDYDGAEGTLARAVTDGLAQKIVIALSNPAPGHGEGGL